MGDLIKSMTSGGQMPEPPVWLRLLLDPWREIDHSIANLFGLDAVLRALCEDLDQTLRFDFSAVQLVRRERRIVENWCATRAGRSWEGRSRHYLHLEEDLRDIQADVALKAETWPLRIEVLRGWDPRFDPTIYETFGHHRFVRAFAPLVVVRTVPDGRFVTDWPDACRWSSTREVRADGERLVVEAAPQGPAELLEIEVIGTIETGWTRPDGQLGVEEARRAMEIAARWAEKVYRARQRHVLETIAEQVRSFAHADSATLHYLYDSNEQRYLYEVHSAGTTASFLKRHPPHRGGLGEVALREQTPQFASVGSRPELMRPGLTEEGIQAASAFPFFVDGEQGGAGTAGVLYLYFRRDQDFQAEVVEWVQFLTERAAEAIQQSTGLVELRDQTRQLRILQSVVNQLVGEVGNPELPATIARSALNTLAADLAIIYQYDARDQSFRTPPTIAGRLRYAVEMTSEVREEDAPALLIHKGPRFVPRDVGKDEVLGKPDRARPGERPPFVARESIQACAAVLLEVGREETGREIVGAMFINYRRPHAFSKEEIKIVEVLASAAAIAIKNQRLMERREEDLQMLAHDLRAPLPGIEGALDLVKQRLEKLDLRDHASLSRRLREIREDVEQALALSENTSALAHGLYAALARDEGFEVPADRSSVDLLDAVRYICERVRRTSRRSDLKFEYQSDPPLPRLLLAPQLLSNVLLRLVENTTKYASANTTVRVACRRSPAERMVRVEVSSVGSRIEPEEREWIFRKYTRGRATARNRRRSGTGIGLWAARRSAWLLKGDLRLELDDAEPDRSTFVLEIPLDPTMEPAGPTGTRILWLDDQEENVRSFVERLRDEGYIVEVATRLSEGERRLGEEKFDLVILDVLIPIHEDEGDRYYEPDRRTGLRFYQLQKQQLLRDTPVLVVSDLPHFKSAFLEAGLPQDCFLWRLRLPKALLPKVEELTGHVFRR